MEPGSGLVVLDLSQLRNVTLNDEALMREVLRALLSDAAERIRELDLAIAKADTSTCVRVAHSAQGACGNVGAVSLAASFRNLESQAQAGDLDSSSSTLRQLQVELEKLRSTVSAI